MTGSVLHHAPWKFRSPHFIEIKSDTLVILHTFLVICVLSYQIIFVIVLSHGYASFEQPVGISTLWDLVNRIDVDVNTTPSYCVEPEAPS